MKRSGPVVHHRPALFFRKLVAEFKRDLSPFISEIKSDYFPLPFKSNNPMFKHTTACLVLFMLALQCGAQIQVSKLLGKNAKNYKPGYGAFLKFSCPVSEADDATLEGGVNFFLKKTMTRMRTALPIFR